MIKRSQYDFKNRMEELGLVDGTDYNSATLFDYNTLETLYPEIVEDFNSTNKTGYSDPVNECCFFGDRYWYHPDYLGSVAMVTNDEGVVHQFFLTNAWGEELHTYNNANTSSFNSEYRFNDDGVRSTASIERCARSAELDEETGLAYYGARYYDNKISMWLSVDPLAMEGKNMSLTPYHFTSNNPVMRIDPDGLNDYFSEDGVFLGSDDSKDDGIRILSTEAWNTLSQEDEEGNEYIDKASGLSASLLASESDLSTDAMLSIYQHYNPTDLLLADSKNITKGGFEFIPSFNGNDPYLRVHVETNSTLKLIDHSSEIISGLIHEKQHYSDYVEMGAVDYFRLPKNFREVRAYNSQTTHESWNNTRSEFQRNVLTNAVPFGFHLPIILPKKGVVFPEVELN